MIARSWQALRTALDRVPEVVKIAVVLAVYYTGALWVFFHPDPIQHETHSFEEQS